MSLAYLLSCRAALVAAVPVALLAFAAPRAQAQIIERSQFTATALTETFTDLGLPGTFPGPLVLNGVTYSLDTGNLRYTNFLTPANAPVGQALSTNNSATTTFNVVFDTAFQRVGLDAGFSQGTVSFYDASNNLLNTQTIADSAFADSPNFSGLDFVGFESAGGIKRVSLNLMRTSYVLAIDNVSRENFATAVAAPEPGSVALLLTAGVPVVGLMRRRNAAQHSRSAK